MLLPGNTRLLLCPAPYNAFLCSRQADGRYVCLWFVKHDHRSRTHVFVRVNSVPLFFNPTALHFEEQPRKKMAPKCQFDITTELLRYFFVGSSLFLLMAKEGGLPPLRA